MQGRYSAIGSMQIFPLKGDFVDTLLPALMRLDGFSSSGSKPAETQKRVFKIEMNGGAVNELSGFPESGKQLSQKGWRQH